MARTPAGLDETIADALEFVRQRINVSSAILFGSHAAGTPGPYSDIDLAVFSPDVVEWTVQQRIDFAVEVKLHYGDVELHLFADTALENARPSNFYGHLLETGRRVA